MSNNEKVSLLRRMARVVFRQKKYLEHRAGIREVYFGIRIRILMLLTAVIAIVIAVLTLIMFLNQKELLEEQNNEKARSLTRILSGPAEYYLDKNIETTQEELRFKLETIRRECTNFKTYNSDIVKIILTDEQGRVKYSTSRYDYKRKYVVSYIKKTLEQESETLASREFTVARKNKKTGETTEKQYRAITYPIFLQKGNVVKLVKDFERFYNEYHGASVKRKQQIYVYLWDRYRDSLGEEFDPANYKKAEGMIIQVQKSQDIDFLFQHLFNNIMKYRMKYVLPKYRWIWKDDWLIDQKKKKFKAYLDDNAQKAKEINDLIIERITSLYQAVDNIQRLGALAVVFDVNAQKEAAEKNIKDIIRIALIMILVSCVAFFIVLQYVIQNLKHLERWAISVGDGNLDSRIEIKSNDEIGRLSDITNYMIGEIKDKYHLVSLSTKSMIQEQRDTQTSPNLGVTSRETYAFIFSDVRGFTSFSEKNDPATVVEVLNFYLELQSEIVTSHKGDINDYVGDEIMAHFSGRNKVDQAISCAVAIMKKIKNANEKRKNQGLPVFEVGIGLHSGDVVVGNIGSKFRMDFACVGDTVNLASRLCSIAGAGEIIASKVFFRQAKKKYTYKQRPSVELKGKERKIPIVKIEY